jgi:hypothetical protein
MRPAVTFLLLALVPGCAAVGAPGAPLLAIPAAAEALSLRAFGRTMGDGLVSLVTGEDCSIARIGRGEAYCGQDNAPAPPPICTRSLGAVDCWTVPPAAYRGVADGPATLTEAQENNRIGWVGRVGRAVSAAATPAEPPPPAVPVVMPAPVVIVAPSPAPSAAIEAVAAEAAARAVPLPPPAQGVAAGAATRALAAPPAVVP